MTLRFRSSAIAELARSAEVREALEKEAEATRDRARRNARAAVPKAADLVNGIISTPAEVNEDGELEVKVGYDKDHPGFVLWWAEVGTVNQPATPHLRPAVRGRSA